MLRRKKNRKVIIYIFIVISIFVGVIVSFYYNIRTSNPYDYVIKGDKESIYKRINRLDKKLDSLEFNNLMHRLIDTSNKDLLSVEKAAQYVYDKKMCHLISCIEEEYKYLSNLPTDTTWYIQIKRRYYRESGIRNARIMRTLPIYLKELKSECKKKNHI